MHAVSCPPAECFEFCYFVMHIWPLGLEPVFSGQIWDCQSWELARVVKSPRHWISAIKIELKIALLCEQRSWERRLICFPISKSQTTPQLQIPTLNHDYRGPDSLVPPLPAPSSIVGKFDSTRWSLESGQSYSVAWHSVTLEISPLIDCHMKYNALNLEIFKPIHIWTKCEKWQSFPGSIWSWLDLKYSSWCLWLYWEPCQHMGYLLHLQLRPWVPLILPRSSMLMLGGDRMLDSFSYVLSFRLADRTVCILVTTPPRHDGYLPALR